MPSYFFHVSGSKTFIDTTGSELKDDDAAWSVAVSSGGELLRDLDGHLPNYFEIKIGVVASDNQFVAELHFSGRRRDDKRGDDITAA